VVIKLQVIKLYAVTVNVKNITYLKNLVMEAW